MRWVDAGEPVQAREPYSRRDFRQLPGIGSYHAPNRYEMLESDRDFRLHDAVLILSGRCGYTSSMLAHPDAHDDRDATRGHVNRTDYRKEARRAKRQTA